MRSWKSPSLPTLNVETSLDDDARIRLHDTVTGELAATGGPDEPATLYVCGITPYDATHLGHAATYLNFDLLNRAWRDMGRRVTYVQNVTDVDDPLLERAEATGVDWRELAEQQIDLFREDMVALRVIPPDHYVGVAESIPLVVEAVEGMVDAGGAYRVPTPDLDPETPHPELGDVYADFATDPLFACGAHLSDVDLTRVFGENGGDPTRAGKRGELDALLWRRARVGEPSWDGGSLGKGRPGWHIECSAIARKFLGDGIEVQGGGRDLVFPHHEMSESHLRALTGREAPVSVHAHVGMVAYEGTKMSKSLGNLVLVSELRARGVDPAAIRLVVYAHHYREDWEYTDELLEQAQERLATWRRAVSQPLALKARIVVTAVRAALAEDLDAPIALHIIDLWARDSIKAAAEGNGAVLHQFADERSPHTVRAMIDALLGIKL